MRISVTQDHIRRGERYMCMRCPVAIAIREQTGNEFVKVNKTNIRMGQKSQRIDLRIRNWIKDFDVGNEVEPFSFELTL